MPLKYGLELGYQKIKEATDKFLITNEHVLTEKGVCFY